MGHRSTDVDRCDPFHFGGPFWLTGPLSARISMSFNDPTPIQRHSWESSRRWRSNVEPVGTSTTYSLFQLDVSLCLAPFSDRVYRADIRQTDRPVGVTRRPTNWWGSAKRDVTYPTATVVYRLAITCSENVHEQFCPCITIDRDNNTTADAATKNNNSSENDA